MNKILIFILILFFITNNYAQNEMEKINTIIHNVKDQFAPDKRTSVFNIEVVQENEKLILKGETNLTEANTELAKLLSDQNIKN